MVEQCSGLRARCAAAWKLSLAVHFHIFITRRTLKVSSKNVICDSRQHFVSFANIYKLVIMCTTDQGHEQDPFDSLLTIEDSFYKEGYDLGVSDGNRAGLIEGRFFGLEKGFEKYASIGNLHGRAVIWTGRLPVSRDAAVNDNQDASAADMDNRFKNLSVLDSNKGVQPQAGTLPGGTMIPALPANTRLEKHIRTLYALTEPESLSTNNDENSVSEFDDRFNRARGKIKVIEKITGEMSSQEILGHSPPDPSGLDPRVGKVTNGDGGIEDISSLHARH